MNHELILAAIRKIIEPFIFEAHDSKLVNALHGQITQRFFHNTAVEVVDVGFDSETMIFVVVAIEGTKYRITAEPHKFQQFSGEFHTTRVLKVEINNEIVGEVK